MEQAQVRPPPLCRHRVSTRPSPMFGACSPNCPKVTVTFLLAIRAPRSLPSVCTWWSSRAPRSRLPFPPPPRAQPAARTAHLPSREGHRSSHSVWHREAPSAARGLDAHREAQTSTGRPACRGGWAEASAGRFLGTDTHGDHSHAAVLTSPASTPDDIPSVTSTPRAPRAQRRRGCVRPRSWGEWRAGGWSRRLDVRCGLVPAAPSSCPSLLHPQKHRQGGQPGARLPGEPLHLCR